MIILILAGGKSKDFDVPKPFVKLLGKPLIKYTIDIVEEIFPDIKKIVVAGDESIEQLKKCLEGKEEVKPEGKPLGTAHAVYVGLEGKPDDEDVLILYSDTPLFRPATIFAMFKHHVLTKADITFMSGLTEKRYPYAVVYRDKEGKVIALKEHKEPDYPPPYEYSIGAYLLKVGTFRKHYNSITPDPKTGQYYLPDILYRAIDDGEDVEGYICLDENEYLGINTKGDLKRAEEILLEREVQDAQLLEERYIRFGTGGWRAKIGSGFTLSNVKKLTQAIATYLKLKGTYKRGIVIGYDNRFLSDVAAKTAAGVFAANNIKVFMSRGAIPTPLVTFTVLSKHAASGIVITASHNPYDYNGIKVETEEGLPIPVDMSKEIEVIANNLKDVAWIPYEIGMEKGFVVFEDFRNKYLDYLEDKLDYQAIKDASFKVCFDSMYGSGTTTIQKALIGARCDLELIHGTRDALFGGLAPAPTKERISTLIATMKRGDFDVGMAVDGDADRIVLVDEKGNFLHTNEVIALLWYYLHRIKGEPGGVVRNVATSHNIDRVCNALGERVYEVPVGFKYIAEGMIKHNALIGGESSGGITFRGHIMEKDGVFTAMLVIEMLAKTKKRLSHLIKEVKDIAGRWDLFYEYNIPLSPKVKVRAKRLLESGIRSIGGFEVIDEVLIDGYKYILEDGRWVLLRFSGTEPLLRVMGEAITKEEIDKILTDVNMQIIGEEGEFSG